MKLYQSLWMITVIIAGLSMFVVEGVLARKPLHFHRRHQELPSRSRRQFLERKSNLHGSFLIRGGSVETLDNPFAQTFAFVSGSRIACWTVLVSSILLEGFATSLSKRARDSGSFKYLLGALCVYIPCMLGFFVALGKIEMGIAYACWSALGTLVVNTVGILFFGESYDRNKLICLGMITAGVVGLNLLDDSAH